MVVFAPWLEPYYDTPDDRLAVQRAFAFIIALYDLPSPSANRTCNMVAAEFTEINE